MAASKTSVPVKYMSWSTIIDWTLKIFSILTMGYSIWSYYIFRKNKGKIEITHDVSITKNKNKIYVYLILCIKNISDKKINLSKGELLIYLGGSENKNEIYPLKLKGIWLEPGTKEYIDSKEYIFNKKDCKSTIIIESKIENIMNRKWWKLKKNSSSWWKLKKNSSSWWNCKTSHKI